jgi:hypothetical protein
MSLGAPGGNGMMSRIGLLGYACAIAVAEDIAMQTAMMLRTKDEG